MSFLGFSPEQVHYGSYAVVIGLALANVVATVFLFASESGITNDLRERLVSATAEAGKANEGAGRANERAAVLEKEAAQLRIQAAEAETKLTLLQKLTGPRQIDPGIFLIELSKAQTLPEEVLILYSNISDGWYVAFQLEGLFQKAGWPSSAGQAVDPDSPFLKNPPGISPGAVNSGILILFPPGTIDLKGDPNSPYGVLLQAIARTLGNTSAHQDATLSPGQLRLVIFPRA